MSFLQEQQLIHRVGYFYPAQIHELPHWVLLQKQPILSYEAIEKLTAIKPITISQASRISGVTPNDVSILLVYMGR